MVIDGADVIVIFATNSIREGGKQSMTDAQIQAACDEATGMRHRSVVHAQGSEGAKAAILAGCTSIEHGNSLSDEVLDLMAQKGTYFDPNDGVVLQNYLKNRDRFLGIGNFDDAGFGFMERGIATGLDTFRRALAHHVKLVFGTDAVAGAHGHNAEEFVARVQQGDKSLWRRSSRRLLWPRKPSDCQTGSVRSPRAWRRIWWRWTAIHSRTLPPCAG